MSGASGLLQRERELAELTGAFAAAREGRGTVTVIAGPAGTGKSALLAAAADLAEGLTVRRSRGSELEQEMSFGIIRQLFEPALRSVPAKTRELLLSGAAAPAGRLFADLPLSPGAADDGGFATLHGLYWLIAGMAASEPLMLAVDDVHWADAHSLRALAYLAGRLADLPVALVVTLRPNDPSPVAVLVDAVESQPGARRLDLKELSPAGVAKLVRAAIPTADFELCSAFHESSAGNPFYVHELLRSLLSDDGAPPTAAEVRTAALTSVGERVLRRVAALGPDAVPLATAMSVLGMTGSLRNAAALVDQEESAAAAAARAMTRVEILATTDPFEWIHPLVYRSVYDSLTAIERDTLHDRAATVLEGGGGGAAVIAAHLSALRPAGSERVVAGLLRAADEALSLDAPEAAASLLRRALEESAADPPRARLLLKLGQVEVTRRDPIAAAYLREAHDLLEDPRERAFAAMSLAEILTHNGQWDESAAVIAAALAELGGADPALRLELEVTYALVCAFDPALADSFWKDRPRLHALTGDDSWPSHALSALLAVTSAFRGEHLDEVIPLCEHAVAEGTLIAERGAGAWAPAHVLAALVTVEEHGRALAFADEVSEAARTQGSVASALVADGHRGWSAALCGDLAAAEEVLRPLEDTALANGMLLVLVTVLWFAHDLILERSSQADMATFLESLELPPAFAEAAGGAWVMSVRGRVRVARGARIEGEQDLRAAGDIYRRLGFGPLHDPWRSSLALALLPESADEARALVSEELALANSTGFARPRGIALRAGGLIAGGDEGVEILRESVRVLEDSSARYEHARSLVALGSALRRAGRRAESREPLSAGLELAYRCGAERLVTVAREELLVGGARPRRIVRSGFDALTASERRVVRLAVEERSNPEIAQTLFVSLKTVEAHLSKAYAKLGLSGQGARTRLAEAVGDLDPD